MVVGSNPTLSALDDSLSGRAMASKAIEKSILFFSIPVFITQNLKKISKKCMVRQVITKSPGEAQGAAEALQFFAEAPAVQAVQEPGSAETV